MAPLIAGIVSSLISSNLPKVAQAVVDRGLSYVEDKLGVKIEPDENGKLTPELVTQIRLASIKHEEFKMEQETKRIQMEYDGVSNAREMQKSALSQEDVFSKRFVYIFASFWSLVGAVYIFCITFLTVPEANTRIVDMTSGFMLGTVLASMFTYFLGSSLGSLRKDKIIESK